MTREPTSILFPQKKPWQWVKEKICANGPALIKYYKEDASHQGFLWKPEADVDNDEAHAPHLLALPLVLVDLIRKEGRPLMPRKVLELVITHFFEKMGPDDQEQGETWTTIAQWCYLASQGDKDNESLVAFAINAITKIDDEYLGKWLEQRLDTTLGSSPFGANQGYSAPPAARQHIRGTLAAE
jgi:hypothetical protein